MTIEFVVLLDEQGRAIGTAAKSEVHHSRTPLHLAFSAYLFSERGELLVTRRATTKKTFPGVWTNSVCGHPAPGEPLVDAVRRRGRAELGAEVGSLRLVLPEFGYRAELHGIVENERCPVYAGALDHTEVLVPDPTEVDETAWVDWQPFAQAVLSGRRTVSPWCVEQIRQLVALGPEPRDWPGASTSLLPPAGRP